MAAKHAALCNKRVGFSREWGWMGDPGKVLPSSSSLQVRHRSAMCGDSLVSLGDSAVLSGAGLFLTSFCAVVGGGA